MPSRALEAVEHEKHDGDTDEQANDVGALVGHGQDAGRSGLLAIAHQRGHQYVRVAVHGAVQQPQVRNEACGASEEGGGQGFMIP